MHDLVFLDSRDLIACIEHARPVGHVALARELRERNAVIVLTMTNVLETIPRGRSIRETVDLVERLESLPHLFVRYSELSLREFNEAVRAFSTGAAPIVELPICKSFWRVLVPASVADDPAQAEFHRALDKVPMSEQIRLALGNGWQIGSDSNEFDPSSTRELVGVLNVHREILGVSQPNKRLFYHAVATQLEHFQLTVDDFDSFADWLFHSPNVCAAWRLGHEVFQELRLDQTAGITGNGVTDLTHVYFLPYVAAGTLDKQWRDYCHRAARRLARVGIELPYANRLHANIADMLRDW